MKADEIKASDILFRVVQLGLVCVLVLLGRPLTMSAVVKETGLPSQTSAAIPESSAGLQSQLETILRTAKDKKSKQLENMVSSLQIPDDADWFSATFGEELGSTLAATYDNSWKDYEEVVACMFRDEASRKRFQIFVTEYSASSPVPSDSFIQAILQNSKVPLKLYTVSLGKDRPQDTLPGIYTYDRGSFRITNWRTFYSLPGVKPTRVRFGTGIVLNQLIRQVNPVPPPELRGKKLQGSVLVHIVIDRDGRVIRAEPVSGSSELFKPSVDAVLQWLFKPTLLNGDPVEVDTTVTIVYSIHE